MMKHTILFLAANPLSTDRLALDQEARAIQVSAARTSDSVLDDARAQTRQLLRPRIVLHSPDQQYHQEIPPDLLPSANAVRLESATFLEHAYAYALPIGGSERIIGSVLGRAGA